jgi:hypothetical protein
MLTQQREANDQIDFLDLWLKLMNLNPRKSVQRKAFANEGVHFQMIGH